MSPIRMIAATVVLLALCGCGNAPQQPSADGGEAVETSSLDAAADAPASFEESTDPTVTAAVPDPRADPAVVTGRWASNLESCAAEGGDTVTISETRFESLQRSCDVADLLDGGDGSVTASLSCVVDASGEPDSTLLRLTPRGSQLALTVLGAEEPERVLSRCP